MAFLDKLKFWKKREDFDLGFGKPGDELGLGFGGKDEFGLPKSPTEPTAPTLSTPRSPEQEFRPQLSGFAQPTAQPSYQPTGYGPQAATPTPGRSRDMEIVLAKLDAVKALLDSVDHRMAILEQAAKEQKPNRSKYDYY